MLIHVGKDLQPHLQEPEDLRSFKLVIEAQHWQLNAIRAAFAPAGKVEDEKIAWVKESWLRSQAPTRDDPAWQEGFRKMVDYAKSKGWVDPMSGAIRAHIEWKKE